MSKLYHHIRSKNTKAPGIGYCFIILVLVLPVICSADAEKERLEYNFARDNLKRIEEQALKTYLAIINKEGIYMDQAILDVGKHYFNKSEFEKSLEYLNKIYRGIDDEDISAEANLIRGKIYSSYDYQKRNLNETFASFFYIIDVYPGNRFVKNAIFELANLYSLEKDFPRAIKTYCDVIIRYPGCSLVPRILLNIGTCYLKLNKIDAAIKWFEKLINDFPDTEQAEVSKKFVSQILKVNILPRVKKGGYKIDPSFTPNFKIQKAKSLSIIEEFESNRIKAADLSSSYVIDADSNAITKTTLKGVADYFSQKPNKYFTLVKTGISIEDRVIPLSFLRKKGESLKTLKNLQCADIDSKGNFYVVDSVVSGLHIFSQDFKHIKTVKTALDGKVKSIAIDPVDNINLIASSKSELLILDEFGEEIEDVDLKERFGIAKPTKILLDWIGNKFIFDSRNKTIFILDQENELVSRFFLANKGNVLVKNPKDFCIDELSNLYVIDGSNNTIVKFN